MKILLENFACCMLKDKNLFSIQNFFMAVAKLQIYLCLKINVVFDNYAKKNLIKILLPICCIRENPSINDFKTHAFENSYLSTIQN